jgi:hypothetical protein
MASAAEAQKKIADLLANQISLEEFEDWSASFAWNIHKEGDADAQAVAYLIRSILNAHSDDIDESPIREELEQISTPFFSGEPMVGDVFSYATKAGRFDFTDVSEVPSEGWRFGPILQKGSLSFAGA